MQEDWIVNKMSVDSMEIGVNWDGYQLITGKFKMKTICVGLVHYN